jgi:hypothetical protein
MSGFGAVPNKPDLSAIQIRDALQSLTGTDRLDASAIKNIPVSSAPDGSLTYVSDGDTNDLFYWLGTNLGTTTWSNPAGTSALTVVASSADLGTPDSLSDRVPSNFYTIDAPDQWIAWALASGKTIAVSRYTIRSRNFDTNHLPRNWVLEGTNSVSTFDITGINAATWTAIDTRSSDSTLTAVNQYYTMVVNGSGSAFRYIRLRQTGINSNSGFYFTPAELALYGTYT